MYLNLYRTVENFKELNNFFQLKFDLQTLKTKKPPKHSNKTATKNLETLKAETLAIKPPKDSTKPKNRNKH